ncbi:uncharacterized protein LOC123505517 [Portunus trituberculatus]|uniref:uncharacterized protein LOC123505517 n=1 Tax=Portunus trituberculatus TaxID=210409 RepID=UPI001E1CED7E|nr:uncharacterized protein LOC123505517 [Portunus trituberculatus]
MGVVAVMVAALLGNVVIAINTTTGQPFRASHHVCSKVEFAIYEDLQEYHQVAEDVLKQLCDTGRRHVVKEKRRPRGGEQFAILNLHRDAFSATVRWQEGDAKNVVNDSDWRVDEEEALFPGEGGDAATATTFYHWYHHGLPMWPLLNQTLKKTTFFKRLFKKSKKPKWPNYALATPLYLVPYERNNYRNEMISMNKMFHKMENKKQKVFKDTVRFKTYVNEFCRKTCDTIEKNPDSLSNWLVPLIDNSFTGMMASFMKQERRRAPKKTKLSKCPDQLYVFLLREPCRHDALLLKEHIDTLLHRANCLSITKLVVGYSAKVPPCVC